MQKEESLRARDQRLPYKDTGWQDADYENSWALYTSGHPEAGYRMSPDGRVSLKGLVAGGTYLTDIFTLPAGYRPKETFLVPALTGGAGVVQLRIDTDGTVNPRTNYSTWISLSGISFPTR